MSRRSQGIPWILIALGISLGVPPMGLSAQTSGLSATIVLRTQASSIAEEATARLGQLIPNIDQIGIMVEGGTARPLVENAFLDILGRRGVHAILTSGQGKMRNLLQVTVLDQSVRYLILPNGEYRRDVQTAIEARRSTLDSSAVDYLGLFKRQDVDSVAFREEGAQMGPVSEGERTLFDRLLGPVLLIGGAFLIVYLFFTVRN
jgi:hypothetical protein